MRVQLAGCQGKIFVTVSVGEGGLGHHHRSCLCQHVRCLRRTLAAVLDAMTDIGPGPLSLGPQQARGRQLHRFALHSVYGQLLTCSMHPLHQPAQLFRLWLGCSGCEGEHDFHSPQRQIMVAIAPNWFRIQACFLKRIQLVCSPHDREAWGQAAVLLQLAERVPPFRAVVRARILNRGNALGKQVLVGESDGLIAVRGISPSSKRPQVP